jgi:hypothetical protein
MLIGVPKEIKTTNTASAWCRPRCANWCSTAIRCGRDPGRQRHRLLRRRLRRRRCDRAGDRRRGVRQGRDDRQGQGAAGGRARASARRARCCSPTCTSRPIWPQTEDLIKSGATCIAYETVTAANGGLPLLAPMSEVAGRMSIQVARLRCRRPTAARGMLLGGVPGVEPAKVVILGGGVVGANAALMAVGLRRAGDRARPQRRRAASPGREQFGTRIEDRVLQRRCGRAKHVLERRPGDRRRADPGAAAPKLVSAEMVKRMKPGAAVVDVAIDQGGCFETAHATTHADPTYIVDDVVHYCQHAGRGAAPTCRGRAAHLDLRAQQRDAALHPGTGQQGCMPPAMPRPLTWASRSFRSSIRIACSWMTSKVIRSGFDKRRASGLIDISICVDMGAWRAHG